MAYLHLKDKDIANMKVILVNKDIDINTLRGSMKHKEKEAIISKNQIKEKISKYSKKLVGKSIMREARYKIWDQLSLEVTKFRTYIEFVEEEFEIENTSIFKCETVARELKTRPI